uniref:KAP NTPase domain-containing protein n=1 Tax=Chaetoceros debilis TaxID=122233 RepID=A0A7S3VFJ7_9STRA
MECGVKNINILQEICQGMWNTLQSNKRLSTELRRECMERVAVVRKDKKLIKNLTHEGKTGLYLHAVCNSYCVTPEVIEFCLTSFGTECASKRNASGLTPLQCLTSNPMATNECKAILSPRGVNANVTAVGGVSDDPRNTRDRLNYKILADGLVDVICPIEDNANTNFSVGLHAPWGVGKSKLWELIKKATKDREARLMRGRFGNVVEMKRGSPPTTGALAINTTCNVIARMACLRSLVLMKEKSNDEELGSSQEYNTVTMKDIETLSLLMAFTFILWVPLVYIPLFLWYSLLGKMNLDVRLPVWFHILCFWTLNLCFCRCRSTAYRDKLKASLELNDSLGSKVWGVLNGNGRHVPLQISNSSIDYSILASAKTAVIIAIRIIPLKRMANIFTQMTSGSYLTKKGIPSSDVKKHIFIEYNAWVFNGSDILWASLMETLWTRIEFEFGKYAVQRHRASINLAGEMPGDDSHPRTRTNARKLALYKFYVVSILSTLLSIAGIIWGLYFLGVFKLSDDVLTKETDGSANVKTVPAIISIIVAQVPSIGVAIKFVKKVLPALRAPPFKSLLRDKKNQRRDFSKDKGFMGFVRLEFDHLFDFLETNKWYDPVYKCMRPVRLSMFLDDLDRCVSKTVMDVLQAIKLLLDSEKNQIVTCWNAIDTRLVVASIEKEYGEVLKNAGVNGDDFLEKTVQAPFCIPRLSDVEKASYIEKLFQDNHLKNPLNLIAALTKVKNDISSSLNKSNQGDLTVLADDEWKTGTDNEDDVPKVFAAFLGRIHVNEKTSNEIKMIWRGQENYFLDLSSNTAHNEVIYHIIIKYIQEIEKMSNSLYTNEESDTSLGHDETNVPKCDDKAEEKLSICNPLSLEVGSFTQIEDPGHVRHLRDSGDHHQHEVDSGVDKVAYQHDTNEVVQDLDTFEAPNSESTRTGKRDNVLSDIILAVMANDDENRWFCKLSKFLVDRPRAMTRFVNLYMISRSIAKRKLGEKPMSLTFQKKLMKSGLLFESWPYRMSWIVQIIEDVLEEEASEKQLGKYLIGMKMDAIARQDQKERDDSYFYHAGESLTSVVRIFFGTSHNPGETMGHIMSRVSLFECT